MVGRILIGLVVLFVAGLAFLYFRFDSIVTSGVRTYGPQVMTVDVDLASVRFNPLNGEAALTGLTLGQPKGYGDGDMAALGAFEIKLDPWSVTSEHIFIDRIYLERPLLDARLIDGKSNFDALLEQLGGAPAENAGGETEDSGTAAGPVMTIRQLEIVEPQLRLSASGGPLDVDEAITLASFTLSDLGTDEKGLAPREVARHILAAVKPQVTKALVEIGLREAAGGLAKGGADELKKKAGGLLGGLGDKLKNPLKKDNN